MNRFETRAIGIFDMGSEITIDGDNDAEMDWSSTNEFATPSTTAHSTTSSQYSVDHDCLGKDTATTKREKLKSLKERTINALRLSVKDTEISGGSGSKPNPTSSLISALAHPRTALKESLTHIVAGRLSTLNAPYIPQTAEAEFIEAHDERDEARKNRFQGDVEDAERKIEELIWQRRNMQVNWTMDRHVDTVMVVPTHRFEFPHKKNFLMRNQDGKIVTDEDGLEKIDYMGWLGQFLLYQSQDLTTQYIDDREQPPHIAVEKTRSSIERLFVSTAPWQEWFIHAYRVYRWEDPNETARWLVLYVVLWHYSYIITFLYSCTVFFTLRRYFYPETKVEDLRRSVERTRSAGKRANRLNEVIEKLGPNDWLDPLVESLGPWAQLQVDDLADFIEILENFYEWRYPQLTARILLVFVSMLLLGLVADYNFCMKLFYFVIGLVFFVWFPISSRYPRYRRCVSPLRLVFWGIPNHAEWAFQELGKEAQNNREKILSSKIEEQFWKEENDPEASGGLPEYSGIAVPPDETDLGRDVEDSNEDWSAASESLETPLDNEREFASFKCRCGRHLGRLVIYPSGIRFQTIRKHRMLWNRPWWEFVQMRKIKSTEPVGKLLSLQGLEISFMGGEVIKLVDMVDRDEAFKWIVGYSRLRWKSND